jgi:Fe-S-cluster-containing dehydrogenase component/DMSO reductase anchor subunit
MNLLSAVGAVDATPISAWIAAQGDLSAVERFSQRHTDAREPLQARYYRDLLPAHAPGPGQQYAFSVDLDACTGCKACVSACHSLNGLDDGEGWRRVGLLAGRRDGHAYQQHVTAACHHCVDPACMQGCPVDAYEKDPITGIVSHLDDQCIGCSYCTLTCPYEVPVYDHHRGIVRKCDMCAGRLTEGEAPACVQGCPNGAIAITVVDVAATVAAGAAGALVPGAPPSSITGPSTRYHSASALDPDGAASAPATTAVARAHPPLTFMLVLTQLAVGAFATDMLLRSVGGRGHGTLPAFDAAVVLVAAVVALGASVLHLGRPLHCYRAVIGVRHSWLSREVVAFGAFTGLAVAYASLLSTAPDALGHAGTRVLGGSVAMAGVAGVTCSVLLYTRTRRASWTVPAVTAKFASTAAAGGIAAVLWMDAVAVALGMGTGLESRSTDQLLHLALAMIVSLELAGEALGFRHLRRSRSRGPASSEADRRARVLAGPLRRETCWRFTLGLVAGVALPLLAVGVVDGATSPLLSGAVATTIVLGVVGGELVERTTFFTASAPAR